MNGEPPTIEKSERKDIGNKISETLESADVLGKITGFEEEHRGAVLGAIIEYLCLHDVQTDGLQDFIGKLRDASPVVSSQGYQEGKYDALLISTIARKLSLSEPLDRNGCRAVGNYLVDRLVRHGQYYHSFNGAHEKSIREKGLLPDAEIADRAEMDEIAAIGRDHGVPMILGWYKINSAGKIFFDGHGMNIERYAVASPEWFAQFCSEGSHVPTVFLKKSAFYRRDYATAKQNVLDLCAALKSATPEDIAARKRYPNITPEEEQKLMAFFEKYWARFASADALPKVALIAKSAVEDVEKESVWYQYDAFCERLRQGRNAEHWTDQEALRFMCSYLRRANDAFIEKAIAAKDISVVTLPTYNQIHPKRIEW
jgi:hypothetical protein